ncbi:type II toxin-antitoxin system VapB family antitoxin [Kitasatospora sp. NPDC058032]|uniref:type II toxin-antitoxin system VapB family antitoxin n=1 Tax=Kitasatospora sp. NPDC058032 TaxID=3346307 RepID=UPI0036DE803B
MTNVDVDDAVLAEAMRLMGTSTKKDTVNGALADHVKRLKRLEALERLSARAARGEFDPTERIHRARKAGGEDLLLCSVAVHHGDPVLHVDSDFATAARVITELREQDIREP